MDPFTKDLFEVAAWVAGVLGGLFAAWKALVQLRRSNEQRQTDLIWRQAETAKTCLDELFASQEARAALKMLDWDGLSYDTSKGVTQPIHTQKRRDSLRTVNTDFVPGDDGPFIRDAYDALFDKIERLEHFIQIDLIRFKDVAEPLRYYVVKLAARDERPVIERFIATYGFTEAQSFLNRFREWKPGAEDKPLALRPWWKFWRVG